MTPPICKACGLPISGRYLTALNATWHPEHFLCTACQQPMAGSQFTLHEGKPYHIACYAQNIAPRCAYCGKPLLEEYLVDSWGTPFCKEHQSQYPSCVFCGRLVPPEQQDTKSESLNCPICRASAIETAEGARPLFTQVKQWIGRQGLIFNNLPISLELCGRARLAELLHDRNLTHAYGATLSTTYTQNGYKLYTQVRGVSVLRGLPSGLFQGVAVHELGHVWLIVQDVGTLPPWAEEGFCELLSYRWYTEVNTPESRYYATNIERHADPIYGEGFRRVKALTDRVGFPRLLETLRMQKCLPA